MTDFDRPENGNSCVVKYRTKSGDLKMASGTIAKSRPTPDGWRANLQRNGESKMEIVAEGRGALISAREHVSWLLQGAVEEINEGK